MFKKIFVITIFLTSIGVSFANAHAGVENITPILTENLTALPKNIEITFNEPVTLEENNAQIINSDGKIIYRNSKLALGKKVVFPTKNFKPGFITLRYSVISEDGHRISNSIILSYKNNILYKKEGSLKLKSETSDTILVKYEIRKNHKLVVTAPGNYQSISLKLTNIKTQISQEVESNEIPYLFYKEPGNYVISLTIRRDTYTSNYFQGELKL